MDKKERIKLCSALTENWQERDCESCEHRYFCHTNKKAKVYRVYVVSETCYDTVAYDEEEASEIVEAWYDKPLGSYSIIEVTPHGPPTLRVVEGEEWYRQQRTIAGILAQEDADTGI